MPSAGAASFTYNPVPAQTGKAVQFTDTSNNSPNAWQWHFGDGTTSTTKNPSHTYGTAATYTVTLDASNTSGTKTASQAVTVIPSSTISASFTFSPASPAAGQAVQFTDTSTGSPTSWQWSFGDGATSTAQNPSHTYASAASYTVTLTATNSSGSQSVSRTVAVVPALTASFTFSPASPVAGQAVQFTDTSTGVPTSWQWNLGDGTTSTAQNPSHTFTTAASYTVTLTVSNSTGSKSVSRTVTVVPAATLTASFTYAPASPVAGQAVQFTDTSTGSPTSWQWNFGDGTTSTAQNPSHTYASAAAYTVTLTATNSSSSQSASRTVTVVPALTASFTFTPSSPTAGQAVQFTDTSTGSPTSWQWNFGDGMTSTAQNPSHTYASAASYTVNLTATNSSGSKNTTRTVTIVPALTASFTFTPSSPTAGQAVQFTDTSTGSPTSWQWNFGDGTTSTAQNPSHTYTTVASYTVTLTVSNSSGSKSVSRTINVLPAATLTASFTYSPASPVAGQAVQFTDTSTGSPTSWQWDFGDGTSSTVQNPSHVYTAAASYLVTLTIRTGSNLNSTNKTITIGPANTNILTAASPSFADVSAAIAMANPGDTVIVPAGTATWSSGLSVTKAIRIIGAGIGNTIINGSGVSYNPTIKNPSDLFRLSGFTFNSSGSFLTLSNSTATPIYVRIDHNQVTSSGDKVMQVSGTVYGCVDSNTFTGQNYISSVYGLNETSWNNLTFRLGTSENLFFEDNALFGGGVFFAGGAGGRYCVRYNTGSHSGLLWPYVDQHGNQGAGTNNAGMGTEVYENTLSGSSNGLFFDHRGGRAVCFNNTISTNMDIRVREEYNDSTTPPATAPDGERQAPNESYYWNNKNGANLIDPYIEATVDYGGNVGIIPRWDHSVFKQVTSFTGASGIGVGPLSSRPATCTTENVGYWATDVKKLYKWTATNGWQEFYTPYTYPHPLRSIL
jgi:PKD repeat protein